MFEATRLLRQAILLTQRRPAIRPIHEFVGEAEEKVSITLPREVEDLRDAALPGYVLPHADNVRIVEADRPGHANAVFFQGSAQLAFVLQVGVAKNLTRQGAGVFRVDVASPLALKLKSFGLVGHVPIYTKVAQIRQLIIDFPNL